MVCLLFVDIDEERRSPFSLFFGVAGRSAEFSSVYTVSGMSHVVNTMDDLSAKKLLGAFHATWAGIVRIIARRRNEPRG